MCDAFSSSKLPKNAMSANWVDINYGISLLFTCWTKDWIPKECGSKIENMADISILECNLFIWYHSLFVNQAQLHGVGYVN